MTQENFTRRSFLKTSGLIGTSVMSGTLACTAQSYNRIRGANDRIHLAVAGMHYKGKDHIKRFSALQGVSISALCDVDRDILQHEARNLKAAYDHPVSTYQDYRVLLENRDIDAVVLVTPNHWHALQAIWACQAGKDVYVEKPVSHNVFEGRKIVEAAEKYNRIVQAGTQRRSDEALVEAFQRIQNGELGKIQYVRGLCYKRRKSIGRAGGPQPIPASVDYDLWTGPAPLQPLMRKQLHYDWHWQWDTGNGEIGNQGPHELDMCRWVLNENRLPKHVVSFGGRLGYEDDGETPNTQVSVFNFETAPVVFEVRGLPLRKGLEAMGHYKNVRIGLVVQCEQGYFAGGAGGGWFYDTAGKKLKQFTSNGGEGHSQNFIDAIRSRNPKILRGGIENGHLSSAMAHLANISYRLGQDASVQEILKEIMSCDPKTEETIDRFSQHLSDNDIVLKDDSLRMGPWLTIDRKKERFVDQKDHYGIAHWANQMLKREYREPFVVREEV